MDDGTSGVMAFTPSEADEGMGTTSFAQLLSIANDLDTLYVSMAKEIESEQLSDMMGTVVGQWCFMLIPLLGGMTYALNTMGKLFVGEDSAAFVQKVRRQIRDSVEGIEAVLRDATASSGPQA